MKFAVAPSLRGLKADALVLGYFRGDQPKSHPVWTQLPASVKTMIVKQLRRPGVSFDWNNQTVLQFAKGPWQQVVVVGLGHREDWNTRRHRLVVRRVIRLALGNRWSTLVLTLKAVDPSGSGRTTENAMMAAYEYRLHRQEPKSGWPEIRTVTMIAQTDTAEHAAAAKRGKIIGEMVNHARDLANMPGGLMTPKVLASDAVKLAKGRKLKVRILQPTQMEKLKMGALLGVAKGSAEPPRLIVMEYWGGKKSAKPLAFVGKGVTFDSGGLNIKPGDHMYEMHMDMAGGGAVMSAIAAIAELRLPVNVVAVIPAVENMPSGSGYRPGDLLKSMSGKVIEVMNTDAEGRVILADGLHYVQKFYQPSMIVDLATLTGAAVAALGQRAIAMFTRQDFEAEGRAIGEASGDYVWPLPMWEEYDGDVKGTFGDVSNVGKTRYGDAIHGAKFLQNFVDAKTPWVHLDIAPTMTPAEGDALAKGATGTGVRWLIELAQRKSA